MYGKAKTYLPNRLCDSFPLYQGTLAPSDYAWAAGITALLSVLLIAAALPLTKRRQI